MDKLIRQFLPVCMAVFLFSGCTTTRLEYDRMTGTLFPQPETVSGDTVTFGTMYMQGDILLAYNEDDTGIAPLTGPADPSDPNQYDYITTAELETVELANRTDPIGETTWTCDVGIFSGTCHRFHAYGIVSNHFYEQSNGVRKTSLLGLMYNSSQRRAFANFYKNTTLNSDNAKYLRSSAHELGHAFNMSHCDGDGSTTIMNQTGVVGNSFDYEFSASSLDHLQNHDKDAVWPGISSRDYACPHVH